MMLFRKSQDLTVTKCNQCQVEFNLTTLRYNCRKCNLLCCSECTINKLLIPKDELVQRPTGLLGNSLSQFYSKEDVDYQCPQRVCYTCYYPLREKQAELRLSVSKANQETMFTENNLNLPSIDFYLDKEIQKATNMLYNLRTTVGGEVIPKALLINAKGVAFFTIIKLGFVLTGRYGTGLVVAKCSDGSWSAPSAVQMSGLGWGFQIGAELVNVILILSTDIAVNQFKSSAQFILGAEIGVSIGPVGRSIEGSGSAGKAGTLTHIYSYAQSKGIFVGVSLEASGIAARPDVNQAYYGEESLPMNLLNGLISQPLGAGILYQALDDIINNTNTTTSSSSNSSKKSISDSSKKVTNEDTTDFDAAIDKVDFDYPINGTIVYSNDTITSSSNIDSITNTTTTATTTTASTNLLDIETSDDNTVEI